MQRNKTRAYQKAPRGIKRANATRHATRWAKDVQKWREPTIYPPKPTVDESVSAYGAARYIGAGEHGGLVSGDVCFSTDFVRFGPSAQHALVAEKHGDPRP